MSALLKPVMPPKSRPALAAHWAEVEKMTAAIAELATRIAKLEEIARRPEKLRAERAKANETAAAALRRWAEDGANGPEPKSAAADPRALDGEIAQAEAQAVAVGGTLADLRRKHLQLQQDQQVKAAGMNAALAAELVREAETIGAKYVAAFREMSDAFDDLVGISAAIQQLTAGATKIGPLFDLEIIQMPPFKLRAIPDGLIHRSDGSARNRAWQKWLDVARVWAVGTDPKGGR